MLKAILGFVSWPAWWMGSAGTERGCLLRLVAVSGVTLSAGSFVSPLTGGWALPVAFFLLVAAVAPALFDGPATNSTGPR